MKPIPLSDFNGQRWFPCPICTELREVRITKKKKPYVTCDPCGIQFFHAATKTAVCCVSVGTSGYLDLSAAGANTLPVANPSLSNISICRSRILHLLFANSERILVPCT